MVKRFYAALILLMSTALINAMTIHEAAQSGDVTTIMAHLHTGVNVDLQNANCHYMTPLYCAAKAGQLEAARCLLMYGANANKKIKEKTPHHIFVFTALHQAAARGDVGMINLLLDYHAYVDPEDNTKSTAFYRSCHSTDDVDTKFTPLFDAVLWQHKDAIQALIDHGADVRHKSRNGGDPWLVAYYGSTQGNSEEIKKLVRKYVEKPERPRVLALAAALHTRLGKNSPARILPADGSIHQRIFKFLCGDDEKGQPYLY